MAVDHGGVSEILQAMHQSINHVVDYEMMAYLAIGALVMRGAGCTINDMFDRSIDRSVARTATRPLASGRISINQSIMFLNLQLLAGLIVVLNFNLFTVAVAFASIPIVVIYPLMKRLIDWPQFVLGLCFNWGAIVGYTAVMGQSINQSINQSMIDLSVVLPLYAAGVCWTLVYDTIYAHQDVVDDRLIGVRSTALLFGENTRLICFGFSSLMVGGLMLAGINAGMSWPYWLIGVLGSCTHLLWQLKTLDIHDRAKCLKLFVSNRLIGWLVLWGIILAKIWTLWTEPAIPETNQLTNQSINQSTSDSDKQSANQSIIQLDDAIWRKTGWQLIKEEYAKHV